MLIILLKYINLLLFISLYNLLIFAKNCKIDLIAPVNLNDK